MMPTPVHKLHWLLPALILVLWFRETLGMQPQRRATLSQQQGGEAAGHSMRSNSAPLASYADRLFTDERMAIVIYAPSPFSRQLKCEALVESLRSQGGWGGKLYLVTEQVQCYQHERWTQCGIDADIVVLNDPLRQRTGRRHPLKHGHHWELVKDRVIRADLWDLLQPPPTVQMLMYMHGCDMLVGDSLKPFMEHAWSKVAPRPAAATSGQPAAGAPTPGLLIATVRESGAIATHNPVTSSAAVSAVPLKLSGKPSVDKLLDHLIWGQNVWVLHKTASAALMHAWAQEVLLKPDAREGKLLAGALHMLDPSSCSQSPSAACINKHVQFTTDWSQELACDQEQGCDMSPGVINHLPPSTCRKYGSDMVSDWVGGLDLCVYQQLGYCHPGIMTPFANEWLPYPTCAKLELGLSKLSCQWTCTETSFFRTPIFRTSVTPHTLRLP